MFAVVRRLPGAFFFWALQRGVEEDKGPAWMHLSTLLP